MSRDDREERDDERDEAHEPKDHRKPLSQREVFELYRYDPAVRPYLFAALGALAMIFLVMFLNGSDIGAVAVTLFGLATLAFRWVAAPPFFILFLLYFSVFPFGAPFVDELYDNPFHVRDTHFRVMDVVLVLSVLIYLRCQYRIFGLVHQAMPYENLFRGKKGENPLRRPTSHIDPVEFAWLIGIAVVLVVLGQIAWWLANAFDFAPGDDDFPLRWADATERLRYRRTGRPPGVFAPGASRFFVLVGALFFGYLLVRLVFGYWRLRTINASEGAMVLTDTSWAESHRERVRVEKWRIWGKERAAIERRKKAQEERKKREREREEQERRERRRQIDDHNDEARDRRASARDRDADDDRPRRGDRDRDRDRDEDDRPRRRRRDDD